MADNSDVDRYMLLLNKELENERIRRMNAENQLGEISAFNPIKEPNLVEYQLDLKEELDRLYHLLSGHIIIKVDGKEKWEEHPDDRIRIFSEYGVKQIMNLISFYVNRNTLMSFYEVDTIKLKVKFFAIELADLIYNRYEYFFSYPSPEELLDKYLPILKGQGFDITEEELYQKCIQWSQDELDAKSAHYPMLINAIVDVVDSTYRRALMGKERQSLRERLNISQNTSPVTEPYYNPQPQQKRSVLRPGTW